MRSQIPILHGVATEIQWSGSSVFLDPDKTSIKCEKKNILFQTMQYQGIGYLFTSPAPRLFFMVGFYQTRPDDHVTIWHSICVGVFV